MNAFRFLIEREFWEHRGALIWAPAGTGLFMVALMLLGASFGQLQLGGGMKLDRPAMEAMAPLLEKMPPEAARMAAEVALFTPIMLINFVVAIVVFFYCLGALYDDRRDRSVLFWRSMPVSDTMTVASKATTALVVAPLFALAAIVVSHLLLMLVAAIWLTVLGANGFSVVFLNATPWQMWGRYLAAIPLHVLWMLPVVGWLLLTSAFARRRPFVWAVVVPIAAVMIDGRLGLIRALGSDNSLWMLILDRLRHSPLPVSLRIDGVAEGSISRIAQIGQFELLGSFALWAGAALGIGLLALAVWQRARQEDAY